MLLFPFISHPVGAAHRRERPCPGSRRTRALRKTKHKGRLRAAFVLTVGWGEQSEPQQRSRVVISTPKTVMCTQQVLIKSKAFRSGLQPARVTLFGASLRLTPSGQTRKIAPGELVFACPKKVTKEMTARCRTRIRGSPALLGASTGGKIKTAPADSCRSGDPAANAHA
jgi:hypothetical protein